MWRVPCFILGDLGYISAQKVSLCVNIVLSIFKGYHHVHFMSRHYSFTNKLQLRSSFWSFVIEKIEEFFFSKVASFSLSSFSLSSFSLSSFNHFSHISLIEEGLRKGISDADSEARAAVRRAFWNFADHYKSRADRLVLLYIFLLVKKLLSLVEKEILFHQFHLKLIEKHWVLLAGD